jgi:polar amino acid transport system substrate-binding protein
MAKVVFSKEMGWAIVLILSLLFIVGHLVWLLEQGKDVIADRYSEGISDAFWYAFCIISTVGEGGIYVKRFISRVISVATLFVASCVLLVYIFALVNSKMTAEEMKFHINDLNDLRGKKVAIVSGTHSEDVIRSKLIGSNFVSGTLKEAYQKLDSNRVDAVVFDAAPLLYRANVTSEPGTYAVVGNLFDRQEYGIAMPRGSRLTKEIDSLLLRYKGDSTLDRIGYKYGF